MIIFYISKGIGISEAFKADNPDTACAYHVMGAILMTPIFGRLLGWW
jgi:hypothetical protein